MKILNNKVVWITGASSGLGEALSYLFAQAGCQLVLSGRRADELERVRDGCKGAANVEVLPLDLARGEQLPGKVAEVLEKMGNIDILVNNAGISQRALSKDAVPGIYRSIFEVNFFGTVELSRLVMVHFFEKNAGQFVVISSVAGKIGLPFRTGYSASKHALEGFFGSLRTEVHNNNIGILVVRPGAIRTNIADNALQGDGLPCNRKDPMIERGMDPGIAAAAVLQAVRSGKNVLELGSFRERFLLSLNRWFPRLAFKAVRKMMKEV